MNSKISDTLSILKKALVFIFIVSIVSGCATFRSDIEGSYPSPVRKNLGSEKVSVFFLFSHFAQTHGYDAIPKLQKKWSVISDFDDIFLESLKNISNIKNYSTFTDLAEDINSPERRAEKDSLKSLHDFTVQIRFLEEKSFAKHFMSGFFSTVSLTMLPLAYSWEYSIEVDVLDNQGILLQNYRRSAELTTWVQTLLIFVYPFHTQEMKLEEIYISFLSDIFKQIETEKILKK